MSKLRRWAARLYDLGENLKSVLQLGCLLVPSFELMRVICKKGLVPSTFEAGRIQIATRTGRIATPDPKRS